MILGHFFCFTLGIYVLVARLKYSFVAYGLNLQIVTRPYDVRSRLFQKTVIYKCYQH